MGHGILFLLCHEPGTLGKVMGISSVGKAPVTLIWLTQFGHIYFLRSTITLTVKCAFAVPWEFLTLRPVSRGCLWLEFSFQAALVTLQGRRRRVEAPSNISLWDENKEVMPCRAVRGVQRNPDLSLKTRPEISVNGGNRRTRGYLLTCACVYSREERISSDKIIIHSKYKCTFSETQTSLHNPSILPFLSCLLTAQVEVHDTSALRHVYT